VRWPAVWLRSDGTIGSQSGAVNRDDVASATTAPAARAFAPIRHPCGRRGRLPRHAGA